MSEARDYVLIAEKDKAGGVQIAKHAADKLQNRQTTLLEVVQSLGEYINDDNEKIRARAVSFLTAVITALPPKYLSRQQIQVLCQFLCDRIEDGGAIDGLSRLQRLDRFTNDMAQMVVKAMFQNFADLQSRGVSTRYRILQFLNELLGTHRKALLDLGDVSLLGITELVAGEKDPKNLMLIFSMLRVVMLEWDISAHAGAMFDAVYVYFPITFRPRPDDPYGISAQDLKNRLRECLSCSSMMAPYAIPCLVDKLDSTSTAVKTDVLQTMAACGDHYDPGHMAQYSIPLWDAVKYEVLSAQEPELADEALVTLRSIAMCLSKSNDVSSSSSPLAQYLKPVIKECLEHLQEPAHRQANASGRILKAVSSASGIAFELIVRAVVPPILAVYRIADSIMQQRAILEVFNQIFESAIVVYGSWTVNGLEKGTGPQDLYSESKDKFTTIYGQALMATVKEEVSFRLTAAKGLLLLSKMQSFLEENEIGLFVQYFNDVVLNEESYGKDELKKTAMAGLAEISRSKPRLIMDITFPAFLARLPDTEDEAVQGKSYEATLEGLAEISAEQAILETLVRRLLNKLDIFFRAESSGPFPYTCAVLSTLHDVLRRAAEKPESRKELLDPYYDRVVVGLCKRLAESVGSGKGPLADGAVLDLIGRIQNLIIRHSALNRATQVAENIYTFFTPVDTSRNHHGIYQTQILPLSSIISTWLLAAMPRDLQVALFQSEKCFALLQELMEFAYQNRGDSVRLACLRQIALFVNKHIPPAELNRIDLILDDLFRYCGRNAPTNPARGPEFSVRLVFTYVKSLTLRLAPQTNKVLADLVSLLDTSKHSSEICQMAAAGFGSLLAEDDVISKTNYAQIRLLAPQRVFHVLTPLISEKFKASSSSEEKQNYLTALSGVVATVPSEIVLPELPTLLPLLLQSLDLSDESVKIATLETIAVVIVNNPRALEDSGHIPALTKRLLASATLSRPSSKQPNVVPSLPRTRRLAARCLTLLPAHVGKDIVTSPLLALKAQVLQGLTKVLDDPKRDVRKEAVDARAAWIRGVDEVDEDDDD